MLPVRGSASQHEVGHSVVSYSCDAGYELVAAWRSSRHCREDNVWDGEEAVCQAKDCGREIPFIDSLSESTCQGNTVYGGTPCMACLSSVLTRTATSARAGPTPPPPCLCATVLASHPRRVPPVQASCRSGTLGRRNATYFCSTDGIWRSKTPLRCTLQNCGPYIQALPGYATSDCTGNHNFGGDTCIAACAGRARTVERCWRALEG